jgi:uncharacterized delta-60 repeat protein
MNAMPINQRFEQLSPWILKPHCKPINYLSNRSISGFAMKKLFLLALTLTLSLTMQAQQACALDPAWDTDGKLVADGSRIAEAMVVQPDGKLLVACNPFGDSYSYIKRYNTDGSLDLSYGLGGSFQVQVAERRTAIEAMVLHNGTLYICGSTTTDIGGTNTYVYAGAITANGAWENSFATGGVKTFNSGLTDFYTASDIGVDANNKLYMTGLEWLDNLFIVRMSLTGNLDNSWDGDGVALLGTGNVDHWFEVNDIDFDKAGKVLITGKKYKANNGSAITPFWNVLVARYNSNGSLDGSFATGGIGLYNSAPSDFNEGRAIKVTPANDYVVIGNTYDGTDYDYTVTKVLSNGVLDPAFGNAGWSKNDLKFTQADEYCLTGALMSDGRILCTGNQGSGDTVHFALFMLHPDGSRDQTFAPNGLFLNIFNQNNNSSAQSMAVGADGKVYLGGYTRTCANGTCGPLYMALSRYLGGVPAVSVAPAQESTINLYPNPASPGQLLRFHGIDAADVVAAHLIDVTGKAVSIDLFASQLHIPSLPAGVYFCKLETVDAVIVRRLIIR